RRYRRPTRVSAGAARAAAPWAEPGWPGAQAGAGGVAEPGATSLCAHRRQEAPDPPHVRAGGIEGGRSQASPHRARGAGTVAGGAVAVFEAARAILSSECVSRLDKD